MRKPPRFIALNISACKYSGLVVCVFAGLAMDLVPPASAAAGLLTGPVKVNRTIPQVAPPQSGLEFSARQTGQEIFRARIFEEPLVPVGSEPAVTENVTLATALLGYSKRSGPDDFSSLTDFLETHTKSPWQAAILTDLGLEYYNTAYYSLALEAWRKAWPLAQDATDARGKAIADRASDGAGGLQSENSAAVESADDTKAQPDAAGNRQERRRFVRGSLGCSESSARRCLN